MNANENLAIVKSNNLQNCTWLKDFHKWVTSVLHFSNITSYKLQGITLTFRQCKALHSLLRLIPKNSSYHIQSVSIIRLKAVLTSSIHRCMWKLCQDVKRRWITSQSLLFEKKNKLVQKFVGNLLNKHTPAAPFEV